MNCSADIFALSMMDNPMIIPGIKVFIAGSIISRNQTDFIRNGLIHEGFKGLSIDIINHFRHDLTTTANSPDNGGLTRRATATTTLISMFVLGFTAYKGFVNFHKAHQLAKFIITESCPDAVAHRPSGAIRPCADHPMDLQGAYTLLTGKHKIDYPL